MKTEPKQRKTPEPVVAPVNPPVNRKPKTKVLLVDDHPILRTGLRRMIDQESDMQVCGEAEDGPKAFELCGTLTPDIAVIDISLKGSNGIELVKNLKARYPELPTLVLSMHDESLYAERALRAGSRGYIMKEEAIEQVLVAIRRALLGEIFLSEKMKSRMIQQMASGKGKVESFTVLYGRGGEVEHGVVMLRTAADARALARVPAQDGATLAHLTNMDRTPVGTTGDIATADDGVLEWRAG